MEPIVALSIATHAAVQTALSLTIERQYSPYFDAEDVPDSEGGKWIQLLASDESGFQGRGLAESELSVDFAYQRALPDKVNRGDAAIPTSWCDARVNELGLLKDLFRPGGDLRDFAPIAGATFKRYQNNPVYVPELLIENAIFTGVVRLIYDYEANSE